MGDVLIILSLLYLAKTLLMTSLIPHKWYRVGFGILCVAFVCLSHNFALEQNRFTLEHAMEGQQILTDISIVVIIDLMLTLLFCQSVLNMNLGNKVSRIMRVARYIPSLLIFPVLYYAQVYAFNTFIGMDFWMITSSLAGLTLLVVIIGPILLKLLLPEVDLRLEMTALAGLLIFVLILCCMIFHPSAIMYKADSPIDYHTLLFMLAVVGAFFAAGWLWTKIKPHIKRNNKQKYGTNF